MGGFEVVRSTTIAAPREPVHALIDDFHQWRRWSPWEDVDPELRRDYAGAEAGPGARYAWEGNRKAGKGSMEILESQPDRVVVRLIFEKPWKADDRVDFVLTEEGERRTGVTWRMTGTNRGFAALFTKLVSTDKLVVRTSRRG